MTSRKKPVSKTLFWYGLVLAFFFGGQLVWQYRASVVALKTANSSVLGVSQLRTALTPPTLPAYPLLSQEAPAFAARQYILLDVQSGVFILKKDADRPVPLASTTKIVTALLALERGDLSTQIVVPSEAAKIIGSTVLLQSGERLTVKDVLLAALLNSGNDAAYTLAYHIGSRQIGGDELSFDKAIAAFVQEMNDFVQAHNLTSIRFTDPSGLDDDNVGSAADMARLAALALQNEDFRRLVATKEATITDLGGTISHQLKNSNRLISDWGYSGAIGVKTGFTPLAGHNLVGAIEYQDHTLIAVVFNTYESSVTASASVARDIFDFAKRAVIWQ